MGRRVVTAQEVESLPEGAILDLPDDAILTDLAREWVEKKKIRVVPAQKSAEPPKKVRVAVGSDHAGYEVKEAVKALLTEMGSSFIDLGTHHTRPVDYPDFAHAVALAVALGQAELGILVDGAGIGSAMAANKVPGVRAAACYDEASARNAREHNDANVLTLGARLVPQEMTAKIVRTFLTASIQEDRHRARVQKIMDIERKYYRGV